MKTLKFFGDQARSDPSHPEDDAKSKNSLMAKVKSLRKRNKDGTSDLDKRNSIIEKNIDESLITKDKADSDYAKSINSNHRQSVISINGNRLSGVEYDNLVKGLKDELEKVSYEKESVKQQAEKVEQELRRRDSDIK
ncbi:18116_t:CDS:1, partial [Racocetra fulgida]